MKHKVTRAFWVDTATGVAVENQEVEIDDPARARALMRSGLIEDTRPPEELARDEEFRRLSGRGAISTIDATDDAARAVAVATSGKPPEGVGPKAPETADVSRPAVTVTATGDAVTGSQAAADPARIALAEAATVSSDSAPAAAGIAGAQVVETVTTAPSEAAGGPSGDTISGAAADPASATAAPAGAAQASGEASAPVAAADPAAAARAVVLADVSADLKKAEQDAANSRNAARNAGADTAARRGSRASGAAPQNQASHGPTATKAK